MKKLNRVQKKGILLLVEIVILAMVLIVGLSTKLPEQVAMGTEHFSINEEKNTVCESSEMSLEPGVYKAVLHYDIDADYEYAWSVKSESAGEKGILSNACQLYAGAHDAEMLFWVTGHFSDARISTKSPEGRMITVWGAEVTKTRLGVSMLLIVLMTLFLLVDLVGWNYLEKDARNGEAHISARDGKCIAGAALLAIIVISSLPLLNGEVIYGADTGYHLLRIEGIKDGLLSGQFPVRIHPTWLQGHGYATGLFYNDLFLLLPAVMRLAGFPAGFSYLFYKFAVNVATVIIGYWSFRGIFKEKNTALFATAVYVLNIYRMVCMYLKDHLGQYTAMIFLLLIAYAFYAMLSVEPEEKEPEWKQIMLLTLGMTGIISCHILTCELVAGFAVLFLLLCWKQTFQRNSLRVICKSACITLAINAWFIVPFLESMVKENLIITGDSVYSRAIQAYGSLLPQLMGLIHLSAGGDKPSDAGMAGEIPFTPGPALFLIFILFLFVELNWHKELKENRPYGGWIWKTGLCMGLTLWMASVFFPWDFLQKLGGPFRKLVSALQYPTRLLEMTALFGAILAGTIWLYLRKFHKELLRYYAAVTLFLVVVSTLIFLGDLMQNTIKFQLYDAKGMGNEYLSGREYLPEETNETLLKERAAIATDNVLVGAYQKAYLNIEMNLRNDSDDEGAVDLPLLAYRHYQAYDKEHDTYMTLGKTPNGTILLPVPAHFEGTVQIKYHEPWFYRLAELCSLFATIFFVIGIERNRRRTC